MRGIARICRLIVGLVFVFSGFVKLISPVGTSLIIREYLMAFNQTFMLPAAMALGIALSMTEFLTGVALLLRLRLRIAAWVALILVALFTPLTLYLALFNPIEDCGCFGELVHLDNWQTFFKNLILLPCVLIIFFCRKKLTLYRYPVLEWVFIGLFALMATAVLLQTFLWAPLTEFTDYKVGNEIKEAPVGDASQMYETVFVYEKDGERQTFTLDKLPDDSWQFVESITTQNVLNVKASDADFVIEDPNGVNISSDILSRHNLLLMTIYHPDKFLRRHPASQIAQIKAKAEGEGLDFMLIASDNMSELAGICPVNRADLKLLMTFNRSNGGTTLLDEGIIVRKWTYFFASREHVGFCGGQDPEMTLLMTLNRQRMSVEIAAVLFILLCLAKFIVFYKKKE